MTSTRSHERARASATASRLRACGAGTTAPGANCEGCRVAAAKSELAPGEVILNLDAIADLHRIDALKQSVAPGGMVISPNTSGAALENLGLPNELVDLVVGNCRLSNAYHLPGTFAELARVTVRGGRLFLCDAVASNDGYDKARLTTMLGQAGWIDVSFTAREQIDAHTWAMTIRAEKP